MKTIAIVPAAGSGRRLGSKTKKPFVLLGGKPLVTYAIKALDSSRHIDAILVAAEKSCVGRFRRLAKEFKFKKVIDIVAGGATRAESVKNCIDRIAAMEKFPLTPACRMLAIQTAGRLPSPPEGERDKLILPLPSGERIKVRGKCDIILIHDGARPFVDERTIAESIRLARRFGGCVAASAESDTTKLSGARGFILKTLDRSRIFRAETPQVFRRELIERAYALRYRKDATDDASLVELLGGRIKILEGSSRNIKITTKEDLKLAEVLL